MTTEIEEVTLEIIKALTANQTSQLSAMKTMHESMVLLTEKLQTLETKISEGRFTPCSTDPRVNGRGKRSDVLPVVPSQGSTHDSR